MNDEARIAANRAATARPPMAEHTLRAFIGAYANFISQRSQRLPFMEAMTPEDVCNRFYTSTGFHAENEPEKFRKWAGYKVTLMEQNMVDPFAGREF